MHDEGAYECDNDDVAAIDADAPAPAVGVTGADDAVSGVDMEAESIGECENDALAEDMGVVAVLMLLVLLVAIDDMFNGGGTFDGGDVDVVV
jgi:hypothetical protein